MSTAVFDPDFFPTPRTIVYKMLARVSKDARYVLEPSAGKGDIAEVLTNRHSSWERTRQVDCIELCPDLAAILREKGFPVVGDDWLTYTGVSYYDAVVMNPPFHNGDVHLLKAWDFLHAGEIVCLLNAETLRNPYSATRARLAELIAQHGDVEDLGQCFRTAERGTDVEVVLVYLKKESDEDLLELWQQETTERPVDDDIGADPHWLAVVDTLGNMQHYYDQANVHMLKAFQHLRKAGLYMQANGISTGDYDKIAGLAFDNLNSARAEFARQHRKHAWTRVFYKSEFHKWLDKQQTDAMLRDIEKEGTIPFTKENIKGTLASIFQQRGRLFDISVANVFDELTKYHKGTHEHTEGWKSNDNFKVNKKLVFPWGCEYDHKYHGGFSLRYDKNLDIYTDLDRVLCVLDGEDFTQCLTIERVLRARFQQLGSASGSFDNRVESQYFTIRFFKKGTIHLLFKHDQLWQDFNVHAAKGKAWLGMNTKEGGQSALG